MRSSAVLVVRAPELHPTFSLGKSAFLTIDTVLSKFSSSLRRSSKAPSSTGQSPVSKESSILIVGAGVFGLSTALHLARDGYTNVKLLDRAQIPSPYSAGNDLNKIVRAEYESPFYVQLALAAITQWQTPFWSPYFRLTGYVVATSSTSPQKARDSLQQSFSSIQNHPDFPPNSFSSIDSADGIREHGSMLAGKMPGWSGYFNKHAGYAKAAKALEHAAAVCKDLGVIIVTGDDGYAIELLYDGEADGGRACVGVKTANGSLHNASRTILCLGAHLGSLLPEITRNVTAKAWSVAHIQLSPEEASQMKGCPVVMCRDIGFFFEPDEDTSLIKLSANGAGYTNNVSISSGTGNASLPTVTNSGLPLEDERLIKRLIDEAMPQFSERKLVNKFICWCGDTPDSDYIIDYVPGRENLIVASGDSGHAFKMLPVAGEWTKKLLEAGEQNIKRWKWKKHVGGSRTDDISWRVGHVKDIKDVQMAELTANKASL